MIQGVDLTMSRFFLNQHYYRSLSVVVTRSPARRVIVCDVQCHFFFFFKSSIIKPTTLNTNEQETIGGAVADPAACVVSMPPKYQHVVSSLGSEE